MRRKIKLILLFYRSWAPASVVATALCMWLLLGADLIIMPGILLLKAAVLALVWYFMREYGSRRLYYFSNLGMAPRALWGWSIALDLAIFAISMVAALTYKILWA